MSVRFFHLNPSPLARLSLCAFLLCVPQAWATEDLPLPDEPAVVRPANLPAREFMLTFDDGPLPGKTDKVLAALKQIKNVNNEPVKAAFFMVGDAPITFFTSRTFYAPYEIWTQKGSMRAYPEIVAQVKADGHSIGSHTTHHAWFHWPWLMSKSSIEHEFTDWEQIAGELGLQAKLFRSPYLIESENLTEVARQRGYQIVGGTTVGDASPTNTLDDIKLNVLKILGRDAPSEQPRVLIFHDVFPLTYENLGEIVEYIQQHGYRLVDFDPARLVARGLIVAPVLIEETTKTAVAPAEPTAALRQ